MDKLISQETTIRDLRGIKDMLVAAGDPFLASVMNRAIGCVENQPAAAEDLWTLATSSPKEKGCYIVTVNHWLDGKPVVREAFWNGADWLSCEKRCEITQRVTHWMPLPQPAMYRLVK